MKFLTCLKRATPIMLVVVFALGVLNFGSYNPYNELGSLTPDSAFATESGSYFDIPAFTTLHSFSSSNSDSNSSSNSSSDSSSGYSESHSSVSGTCNVSANSQEIFVGGNIDISWSTTGFSKITLNGEEMSGTSGTKTFTNLQVNTTYTLVAKSADGKSSCTSIVKIKCLPIPPANPPFCELTLTKAVNSQTVNPGDELTYTINIKNTGTGNCTGGGVKIVDVHDQNISFLSETHTENLNAGYGSDPVYNAGTKTLSWNGNVLTPGESGMITWKGKVNDSLVCGTNTLVKNTAKATAKELNDFTNWAYSNTVETNVFKACVVPVPKCESFSVTPTTITRGQSATLNWVTSNANHVTINNGVGEVSATGTFSVTPLASTQYLLTAYGANDTKNTCSVDLTVNDVPVVTVPKCESFTATPSSLPYGGGNVSLAWTTTNATNVSISPIIGSVSINGSTSTILTTSTTFTLTAGDATNSKNTCVVTVPVEPQPPVIPPVVTHSGGGGGSSNPSCELSASDTKIKKGESIKLKWETSRATNVTIVDSKGKDIVSTKDLSSEAKKKLLDGSISVSPSSDTTYTLIAERGSRDRVCKVKIDVQNDIVVSQVRDQQPLIAGIALSDVPYTGFEAGPILTILFYVLLMFWALYLAYLLVVRRDTFAGYQLATPNENKLKHINSIPETGRGDDVIVERVQAPMVKLAPNLPTNLPTGNPVIGYANMEVKESEFATSSYQVDDETTTELENYAHSQHVLLSSDAIRHFVSVTNNAEERNSAIREIITVAKEKLPAEDGWIVINEKRMKDLCLVCSLNQKVVSAESPFVPTVITQGSGSLAEAIVTGNVVAAYELLGFRPMFALADAASDLDSVYRIRKGGKEIVSEMLLKETEKLTDAQLMEIIKALTGALDGTYTDEASAVKMAIMKAVKVIS